MVVAVSLCCVVLFRIGDGPGDNHAVGRWMAQHQPRLSSSPDGDSGDDGSGVALLLCALAHRRPGVCGSSGASEGVMEYPKTPERGSEG
jgi:hypothetical protein